MLIHLTPSSQDYIRGGYDPDTQTTVTIDLAALTAEQRALLARYAVIEPRERHRVLQDGTGYAISVTAPTTAAVLSAIQEVATREARREAERAAARASKAAAQADEVSRVIQGRVETTRTRYLHQRERAAAVQQCEGHRYGDGGVSLSYQEPVPEWPDISDADADTIAALQDSDDCRAWLADLAVRAEAAREAAIARMDEVWAEREAARAEAQRRRDLLRTWAVEHGGERMRLLAEEEMWEPLDRLAVSAYLDAHTPDGWESLADVSHAERDRTRPTAEDIRALRDARALAAEQPEILTEPRLAWLVLYREADPENEEEWEGRDKDGEVEVDKFAAVLLTVVCPTGVTRDVYRRVTGSE